MALRIEYKQSETIKGWPETPTMLGLDTIDICSLAPQVERLFIKVENT